MPRRKTKDIVDLMRQSPEKRLRDVAIPDEDTCRYCDATVLDVGPWHDEKCPLYQFEEEEELLEEILEEQYLEREESQ